jgi:hypothetical protein
MLSYQSTLSFTLEFYMNKLPELLKISHFESGKLTTIYREEKPKKNEKYNDNNQPSFRFERFQDFFQFLFDLFVLGVIWIFIQNRFHR